MALAEAKMWRAGEDKQVEATMASAREDALKEAKQQWQFEKADRLENIRQQAIDKAITFGNRFKRFAFFLIKKKHLDINLSGINFKSMEGNEMPNHDDCIGEGDLSGLKPTSNSSSDSSPNRPKNGLVVNIDFS